MIQISVRIRPPAVRTPGRFWSVPLELLFRTTESELSRSTSPSRSCGTLSSSIGLSRTRPDKLDQDRNQTTWIRTWDHRPSSSIRTSLSEPAAVKVINTCISFWVRSGSLWEEGFSFCFGLLVCYHGNTRNRKLGLRFYSENLQRKSTSCWNWF